MVSWGSANFFEDIKGSATTKRLKNPGLEVKADGSQTRGREFGNI